MAKDLCGEEFVVARNLLYAITLVVNLWLGGRCLMSLVEYVASAPLTLLLKLDGGIQPITAGSIWRQLVSKVAMKKVSKYVAYYINDFQFGVGVSGGAEAIFHISNMVLSKRHKDGSLYMLRVTSLYLRDGHIMSAIGVKQGDSLGPLLLDLMLHPLIHQVRVNCKILLHTWYLNDETIIGDSHEVAKALVIISKIGPRLGHKLNIRKTKFDKELRRAIEDVVVSGGPFFEELQWIMVSLPIKVYGLDHILRDIGVYFNRALDGLSVAIPDFDLANFTRKVIIPPKAHVLASSFF
ncbi:unnamed protein product [Vicia faba]|uniref:Reverse transcriptase domain-containing protein n=1 Tax=Vicia faba TaxID=3906 RepID=A0AAV1ACA3_VICFA|nr:unnamed protein product [Vicia faba]